MMGRSLQAIPVSFWWVWAVQNVSQNSEMILAQKKMHSQFKHMFFSFSAAENMSKVQGYS